MSFQMRSAWFSYLIEPAPAIVLFAIFGYVIGGSCLIARYCAAHVDEIPVRQPDPDPR